jgi:hypothetical protein
MKKVLLLFSMCCLGLALQAQTLTPFVISTSGAFYSNSAGMLSTTIGELAAVTTLSSGNNFLTQGFQQPEDFSVSIPEIQENGLAFDVYPNPSSGNFTLALNTEQDSKVAVRVSDMLGQTVYFETFYHISGYASRDISLEKMAEGVYLLEVVNTEVSSGKTIKNIKKINLVY